MLSGGRGQSPEGWRGEFEEEMVWSLGKVRKNPGGLGGSERTPVRGGGGELGGLSPERGKGTNEGSPRGKLRSEEGDSKGGGQLERVNP